MPASVLRARLDDEEVLLNTDTGRYHLLNATGTIVLGVLERGEPLGAAVIELIQRTDVDEDTAKRDADAFITALLDRGLLLAV